MVSSYLRYLHRVRQFIQTKPIRPVLEYCIGKERKFGVCEYGVNRHHAKITLVYFHGTPACRYEPSLHSDQHQGEHSIYEYHKIRLICIERPGFGVSTPVTRSYSVNDFARDILEHEAELSLPRHFSVLGFSAGAPYVWAIKALVPHRIESAVIVAGVVDPNLNNFSISIRKSLENVFFGLPISVQTLLFRLAIELVKLELKLLSIIFQILQRLGAKSLNHKLDSIIDILDESSRQGYEGVTLDTLRNQASPWGFDISCEKDTRIHLFYSLEDLTVPPSEARRLAKHTGLKVTWLEGGHLCLYLNLRTIIETAVVKSKIAEHEV